MTDALIAAADATGVAYEIVPCDPELADTAAFCAAYGYTMEQSANTIVVVGKVDPPVHAACVVLAHTRLDVNKVVRKRLGVKKASFAPPDDTLAITGMQIGGVTPFGLPAELPLWIDARVMDVDRIVLGGGSRDRKVLAPPEILTALGGEVVDDLAKDSGMSTAVPILRVADAATAVEWYRRLGFDVDFEHRFAPELPAYVGIVRDDASIHLSEHAGDASGPGLVHLWVDAIDPIAGDFGLDVDEMPWARGVELTDPDGNRIRVAEAK